MSTATVFPANYGDVATVTCSTGTVLSGDNVITCQEGTEFYYIDVPTCSVLGKLFNKVLPSSMFTQGVQRSIYYTRYT